jgi:hypothetical protein
MREISEETFGSIHSFMKGLNNEQVPEFVKSLQVKQPSIHAFIYQYLGELAEPPSLGMGGYIFAIIIRCYEYEYGEFQTITPEKVLEFHTEKMKNIAAELKRKPLNKVVSGLRREARQRVMIEYLDIMMMGSNDVETVFNAVEKEKIRVAIYMIIILLNEEMEKILLDS